MITMERMGKVYSTICMMLGGLILQWMWWSVQFVVKSEVYDTHIYWSNVLYYMGYIREVGDVYMWHNQYDNIQIRGIYSNPTTSNVL